MYHQHRVSVIIPALNEEKSIGLVIADLFELKNEHHLQLIDEIIVCDNGSSDQTNSIATSAGAKLIYEPIPGYGRACIQALKEIEQTDIILFIDADHAFYAHQAIPLIHSIHEGADLAIGSRTLGTINKGALTQPQLLGNQLATVLIKLIWHKTVSDLGPFRAIRKEALDKLKMQDRTFGWTIEMQIKAIQKNMRTIELPVDTRCRIGTSKISGTLTGTIGAGVGILSMIAKLWWQGIVNTQSRVQPNHQFQNNTLQAIQLKETRKQI